MSANAFTALAGWLARFQQIVNIRIQQNKNNQRIAKYLRIMQQFNGCSYIICFDTAQKSSQVGYYLFPFTVNGTYFFNFLQVLKIGIDGFVFFKIEFIDNGVGEFMEHQKVGNSKIGSSYEWRILSQNLLQFIQGFLDQLLTPLNLEVHERNFLSCLFHLQINWSEQSWSESALVPREILINQCSLLSCISIVFSKLLGESLTKVNKNGVALSKPKVSMSDIWNFPKWIFAGEIRFVSLSFEDIQMDKFSLEFAQIGESLHCSSRLTGKVPIDSEHQDIVDQRLIIINSQSDRNIFVIPYAKDK